MNSVFKSFLALMLIVLGFVLVILGVFFYVFEHVASTGIETNGTTVIIIPPFIVISGGLNPYLLIAMIVLVLLIPVIIFFLVFRNITRV